MRTVAWLLAGVGALLVGFYAPVALSGGITGGWLGGITIGLLVGLAALSGGLLILFRNIGSEREDASPAPKGRAQARQEPIFAERQHALEPVGPTVIDQSGTRQDTASATPPRTPYPQPIAQGTPLSNVGKPAKKESRGRDALVGFFILAALLALMNECARYTSDREPTPQAFLGPAIVTRNAVVCYSREAYSEMQSYLSRQDFASIRRLPGCGTLNAGLEVEAVAGSGGFLRGFGDGLTGTTVILLRAPDGQTAEAIISSDAIRQR